MQAGSHHRGNNRDGAEPSNARRGHPLLPQEASIELTILDRYPPYLRLGAWLAPNACQLTTSIIKVVLMTQLIFHISTVAPGAANRTVKLGY